MSDDDAVGPRARPIVDRLSREELREWLDRKPPPKPEPLRCMACGRLLPNGGAR